MERRLMGEELELGLFVAESKLGATDHPSSYLLSCLDNYGIKLVVFRGIFDDFGETPPCEEPERIYHYWLENGAKLYTDTGDHPEYATPECQSAHEVVAHDKAAEIILKNLALSARDKVKVNIIKNNVCYAPGVEATDVLNGETSWGLHENYLVPSNISPFIFREDQPINDLIPHLVSRTVYTGAGHIKFDGSNSKYILSSRASFLGKFLGSSTGALKPFIINRPQAHTDEDNFGRVQIASTEANMLELPIYLKFLTTHLCLRLLEEGWRLPEGFALASRISISALNEDLNCKLNLPLVNGDSVSSIAIQRMYLEQARRLSPQSDEERRGLELWAWVLDLLSQDLTQKRNFKKLVGVLDWATKWYLIKENAARHNRSLGDPRILVKNFSYHSLDPSLKGSLWSRICAQDKEKPFIYYVVTPADIEEAVRKAPKGRAALRGEFIRLVHDFFHEIRVGFIDWQGARCLVKNINQVLKIDFGYSNPFAESSETLEFLKQILGNAPNR